MFEEIQCIAKVQEAYFQKLKKIQENTQDNLLPHHPENGNKIFPFTLMYEYI